MKQHMLTHKIRDVSSSEGGDPEPPEPPPKRAPPDPDLPLPTKRPSSEFFLNNFPLWIWRSINIFRFLIFILYITQNIQLF